MKRSIELNHNSPTAKQGYKNTDHDDIITKMMHNKRQYRGGFGYRDGQGEEKCVGDVFIIIFWIIYFVHMFNLNLFFDVSHRGFLKMFRVLGGVFCMESKSFSLHYLRCFIFVVSVYHYECVFIL